MIMKLSDIKNGNLSAEWTEKYREIRLRLFEQRVV